MSTSTQPLPEDDVLRQSYRDLLNSGTYVLEDADRRRQVLQAIGAPVAFAEPLEGVLLPIRTDSYLNYWLWCYFERGDAWDHLIAQTGGQPRTLKEILEAYEFHAFAVQGQWQLDLLTSEHFFTNGHILIKDNSGTRYEVRVRLPQDWQEIVQEKILHLLAGEIERFRLALGVWFDEVKEEIGTWLAQRYEGLNPSRKGFVEWFARHHGILNFRGLLENRAPGFDVMILEFREKTVEAHFERLIHRYCQERLQSLHADALPEPNPSENTSAKPATGDTPLNEADTLRPLFASEEAYARSLGLLSQVQPPLVTPTERRWLGGRGSKSGLIAWIEVQEQHGIIPKISNRLLLARCLMNTFPGLRMNTTHSSLWYKPTAVGSQYALKLQRVLT